jgi:Glycosyl hydrolases family 35
MNSISVYAHWYVFNTRSLFLKLFPRGLHNPAPDTFEFNGFLDWQLFLDICKDVGLWVVFRPGQS